MPRRLLPGSIQKGGQRMERLAQLETSTPWRGLETLPLRQPLCGDQWCRWRLEGQVHRLRLATSCHLPRLGRRVENAEADFRVEAAGAAATRVAVLLPAATPAVLREEALPAAESPDAQRLRHRVRTLRLLPAGLTER